MPAAWPASLPQKVRAPGYREAFARGARRHSETDTGPGKVFLKSTAKPRPLSASMDMTGDELGIFESFYLNDLLEGALPFEFPKPRSTTDEIILVRFTPDAEPEWAAIGKGQLWRVNLPLEILP